MPDLGQLGDSDWKAQELAEAWRYGFRWGPLVVERTAHIEGRGYVVTIRTDRQSMQVYVSEKGRKIEPMPVRDKVRDA